MEIGLQFFVARSCGRSRETAPKESSAARCHRIFDPYPEPESVTHGKTGWSHNWRFYGLATGMSAVVAIPLH